MAVMTNEKLIAKLKSTGKVSEKEVNLIKRRLNDGKLEHSDIDEVLYDVGVELTQEQQKKALKWLTNLYKTPTGKARKNNPLGTREVLAIENVKTMYLQDMHNIGFWGSNYVPVYYVVGKDNSFEYYVQGGKIHITG